MNGFGDRQLTWLVTGGAGYIGQHVVRALLNRGSAVVILDDLSSGRADLLPPGVGFVNASITDVATVRDALEGYGIGGVIHLAGLKAAHESISHPVSYYEVNTSGTISLLRAMGQAGVPTLIFSSSAAVYGHTPNGRVSESSTTAPISPYAWSKLMAEQVIADAARATGLSYACLRYFNVGGAQQPELVEIGGANLVPQVLRAAQLGRRPKLFGHDYPTLDGSPIRDFVHVADVAAAHVVVAEQAAACHLNQVYNVGSGRGVSVLEVLECVRRVTGTDLEPEILARRVGDPTQVVADASKLQLELGWQPLLDLDSIVSSTWEGMRPTSAGGEPLVIDLAALGREPTRSGKPARPRAS